MNESIWGSLSEQELEQFKQLKDIQVVFDIGVRDNIDYLKVKPDATYHLFEPNPEFFKQLKDKIGDRPHVYLNNYGVGEVIKTIPYNKYLQAFLDGPARPGWGGDLELDIKPLDNYIEENNITRIDFLKIDAEGYDMKVLQGGMKALAMVKYLQFESWDNLQEFQDLLNKDFTIKDIGSRNYFCERREH